VDALISFGTAQRSDNRAGIVLRISCAGHRFGMVSPGLRRVNLMALKVVAQGMAFGWVGGADSQ
jgi:hypothetical protein